MWSQISKLLLVLAVVISGNCLSVAASGGYHHDSFPSILDEWADSTAPPDIFSQYPKRTLSETKNRLRGSTSSKATVTTHKHLPRTTLPLSYVVRLRTILYPGGSGEEELELTAPGSVQMLIKCVEATKEIFIHSSAKYVTIKEESVKVREATISGAPSNIYIPVVNQTVEEENDFYVIHLDSECNVHKKYYLEIDFRAAIANDTYTGLYLSTYTDPDTNITRRLATTQMEDEHARQMFPHYDNPDFKATFALIIGRRGSCHSMSNMNLIKTEPNTEHPGWVWDHYAPTPKMSSYLIAVIVSDFTCVSAPASMYSKLVKVCGPPYMIARGGGDHSAEVVATILDYYDDFMNQKYPLPHMISVAIPDFRAGAMENWGLNTYRIKGLIFYPNLTSEADRYRIDLTIAHELAHQNFGNLITNKFWNQIWLNEGFATYISFYGLQSVSPEYEPESQWMASYRRRALLIDASPDTHPIVNMSDPFSYFDSISYSKGASLLRMMEGFVSEDVFHKGLRQYLANHAYGTVTQWDLFEAIEKQAHLYSVKPEVATVSEIMETWTLQGGFPLIRVDYISNKMIALSQERFFNEQPGNKEAFPPSKWYVPVHTLTDKTQISPFKRPTLTWLTPNTPTRVLFLEDGFEWIVVNSEGSVFGRILYDDKLEGLIEAQLMNNKLPPRTLSPVTRAQLIEDAFENAWAGYGKIETALNYTRSLRHEHEPVVWSAAMSGLGKIYGMVVEDKEAMENYQEYVSDLVASSLTLTNVEQAADDKGIKVLHRASMLSLGGILGVPSVLQYGSQLVQDRLDSSDNRIPPDLHVQSYCNAIINGDRAVFDQIYNLLLDEDDEDVKYALLLSLGCSTDQELLEELRKNITDNSFGISSDQGYLLLLKLSRNALTRKSLVPYLDDNFGEIQEYFGGVKIIARSLEGAAMYWNTENDLAQLKGFIAKYEAELDDVKKFLQRVVDAVERNIEWMSKYAESVKGWLKKQNSK